MRTCEHQREACLRLVYQINLLLYFCILPTSENLLSRTMDIDINYDITLCYYIVIPYYSSSISRYTITNDLEWQSALCCISIWKTVTTLLNVFISWSKQNWSVMALWELKNGRTYNFLIYWSINITLISNVWCLNRCKIPLNNV